MFPKYFDVAMVGWMADLWRSEDILTMLPDVTHGTSLIPTNKRTNASTIYSTAQPILKVSAL